jgi:hypothetical protein
MFNLTEEQMKLRHKIENLHIQKTVIEKDIKQLQCSCDHVFSYYPNPDVEVKYCVICGFEDYK